jgi:hypothetical protein
MVRKILLSLLVSVNGVLNCLATVSDECKRFVQRVMKEMEDIDGKALSNQEKRTQLIVLGNCVADEMKKKPVRRSRTKDRKDQDTAVFKRLGDLHDKIQAAWKRYEQ